MVESEQQVLMAFPMYTYGIKPKGYCGAPDTAVE
jgi:hypothetical protein